MSSAIVTKPQNKHEEIELVMKRAAPNLAQLMPPRVKLDPSRLVRCIISSIARTPALLECTTASIVIAAAQACAVGLEPGTALGHSYLVPYGNICTFIPGYRGLILLASKSGAITNADADLICEKDQWREVRGMGRRIEHEPFRNKTAAAFTEKDGEENGGRGPVIAAYVVFTLPNGKETYELMDLSDLEKIRNRSKAKDNGPWKTDTGEMYRKTVTKRGLKYRPIDTITQAAEQLSDAISASDRYDAGGVEAAFADALASVPQLQETAQEPKGAVKGSLAEKAGAGGAA